MDLRRPRGSLGPPAGGGPMGSGRRSRRDPYAAVGYGDVTAPARRSPTSAAVVAPSRLGPSRSGVHLSAPALTRPTAPPRTADPNAGLPPNALGAEKGALEQLTLYVFVIVPFLALAAVVPAVWGWGLSWTDVSLFVGFYFLTLLGITVGYHRHFTHGSFKAGRPLRVVLAAIGGMAIQGPVVQWVADHRRHHAFADREGDPHSPWRYGPGARNLTKGMFHAHMGWLFDRRQTNPDRYAPDLVKDTAVRRTSRLFVVFAFLSLALPAVIGGLLTRTRAGGRGGLFLGRLVRAGVLHPLALAVHSPWPPGGQ